MPLKKPREKLCWGFNTYVTKLSTKRSTPKLNGFAESSTESSNDLPRALARSLGRSFSSLSVLGTVGTCCGRSLSREPPHTATDPSPRLRSTFCTTYNDHNLSSPMDFEGFTPSFSSLSILRPITCKVTRLAFLQVKSDRVPSLLIPSLHTVVNHLNEAPISRDSTYYIIDPSAGNSRRFETRSLIIISEAQVRRIQIQH